MSMERRTDGHGGSPKRNRTRAKKSAVYQAVRPMAPEEERRYDRAFILFLRGLVRPYLNAEEKRP